jgi:predicted MPP superfamily phosphohydrolase
MKPKYDAAGFFNCVAAGGAVGAWVLACWLAAPLGLAPPLWAHVAVPLTLAVMIRLAGRPLEHAGVRLLAGRSGAVLLAFGLTAFVAATAVGASAAMWAGLRLFATRAEAGVAGGGSDLLFSGFRPIGMAMLGLALLAMGYAYAEGHRRLVVTRPSIALPDLPPALAGLRVVHVSDLHLGPLTDRRGLRQAFDRIRALDPDLVCVTGDLIDSEVTDLEALVPELSRLTARHGVFAILGNHDRYAGVDRVVEAVTRLTGWRLLRDEVASVEIGGERLHIAGLEDRQRGTETAGLAALLAQVPAAEPFLLLAHRPSIFPAAAEAGVPLMLCGHTHGGQLAVPGFPGLNVARFVMSRYSVGMFRRGGSLLHVTRGLGATGQRVRLGVPREIAELTLGAA